MAGAPQPTKPSHLIGGLTVPYPAIEIVSEQQALSEMVRIRFRFRLSRPRFPFRLLAVWIFIHHEEALALAEELVNAMHWTGIANIDMVLDERDGCFLIEMNGRYWTSMLGSYRAGVNFPDLACLDALGSEVPRSGYRDSRFVRGSSRVGWREAGLSKRTLLWRLADPGPVVAEWVRSCWRA